MKNSNLNAINEIKKMFISNIEAYTDKNDMFYNSKDLKIKLDAQREILHALGLSELDTKHIIKAARTI